MDEHTQLVLLLGEVSGKVDGVLTEQKRISDHVVVTEARVTQLERTVSRSAGWAAGVGAAVAAIASVLNRLAP